ncbi:MAG TPA: DNA repair protein RecO [bacterium]|nr:DNA repair protein RecO [bacterium]
MVAKIAEPVRDSAFLLRSVAYGDDHRILSFLTAGYGRVDMIALGARKSLKRFSGILDFVHCLDIEFKLSERGLATLLQCRLEESFVPIGKSYEATVLALQWLGLLAKALPEAQQVPGVFQLLQGAFRRLGPENAGWLDVAFRRQLLSRLGFHLDLSRCSRCQNHGSGRYYFSAGEGGLVCAACHRGPERQAISEVIPESFWEEDSGSPLHLANSRRILEESFRSFLGVDIPRIEYDLLGR